MTQKELLYIEDAVGHEKNIIKICEDIINNLENQDLVMFMQKELDNHKTLKENLMNKLEEKVNERSN